MSIDLADRLGLWVFPTCFLALLSVPAIWAYQIYHWLRWGEWDRIPVSEGLQWIGLAEPHFAWTGVQKVSDWVMAAPLTGFIFFAILAVLLAFVQWADHYAKTSDAAAKSG